MDRRIAAVIIMSDSGRFFLERKRENYRIPEYAGRYCYPGGHVEPGECPMDALPREIREEFREPAATLILESLQPQELETTLTGLQEEEIGYYVRLVLLSQADIDALPEPLPKYFEADLVEVEAKEMDSILRTPELCFPGMREFLDLFREVSIGPNISDYARDLS